MSTFFIDLMRTPAAVGEHGKTHRCDDPLAHLTTAIATLSFIDIGKGNKGVEQTAVAASVCIKGHRMILPYD